MEVEAAVMGSVRLRHAASSLMGTGSPGNECGSESSRDMAAESAKVGCVPGYFQRDRTLKEYSEVSGLDVHIQKLAKEQSRPAVRQKSLMDWFDALRTRQFIHHVRDRQYGTLPLLDLARHFNVGKAPNKSIQLLRRQCARVIYQ